jgi:hypothetical protein
MYCQSGKNDKPEEIVIEDRIAVKTLLGSIGAELILR